MLLTINTDKFHPLDVENRWSKTKENLMKRNLDLANLQNKKPKKKKQRTEPAIVQSKSFQYL